MTDYRATADTQLFVRTADGATVPRGQPTEGSNALEAWLAAGNKPDPYVAPITPPAAATIAQPLLDKLSALVGMTPAQVAAAISAATRI